MGIGQVSPIIQRINQIILTLVIVEYTSEIYVYTNMYVQVYKREKAL